MANTRISDLTASASNLASTDLAPVVQTVGVGPVKMTGLQLAGGLLGSTTFNGSTVTTSSPVLNLTQTWNAGAVTFTGLKFNVTNTASAALSLALDIQKGGTTQAAFGWYAANMVSPGLWLTNATPTTTNYTLLNISNSLYINAVSSSGAIWNNAGDVALTYADQNTFSLRSTIKLGWGSGNPGSTPDLILTRSGVATLQLGAADAAAPVAQTLQVQSVVAGTSNTAGANWTLNGSASTGNAAGGKIQFNTSPKGGSGTAVNAQTISARVGKDNVYGIGYVAAAIIGTNSAANGNTSLRLAHQADIYFVNGDPETAVSYTNTLYFASGESPRLRSGAYVGWCSSSTDASGGTLDTTLYRDAANTLALRNGTNAQTFNVYNTYTDASNYERGVFDWSTSSNVLSIGTTKAGTGSTRSVQFVVGGTNVANFSTSGALLWNTDSTYNIGATSGNRPANIYAGGSIIAYGSASSAGLISQNDFPFIACVRPSQTIRFGTSLATSFYVSRASSAGGGNFVGVTDADAVACVFQGLVGATSVTNVPMVFRGFKWDGVNTTAALAATEPVMSFQNGTTTILQFRGDGLVQFAGTTSSFPALKRISSGNCLQVIAADNTASAGFIVGNQALATSATDGFLYVPTCAGTPTGTPTTQTGTAPIVVDTTNNKLYFYSGGAWRDAGP